jgi:multiple sugar transport system substrate-binding protein
MRAALCLALSVSVASLTAGCRDRAEPALVETREPLVPSHAHLERLVMDVSVDGREARAVALYSAPPGYGPVASPVRDGLEGVACVDDAARAAVLFLRRWERTRDERALTEARGLLAFVDAMERGDGEVVNFVHADGSPNETAETSRKSFSYWAARTLWATGEALRVLPAQQHGELVSLFDRLERRMAREIEASRLVGGSVTATAEALLGLLSGLEARRDDRALADLARRTAALLAATSRGDAGSAPFGAHVDSPAASWHAWGARAVVALARAGRLLSEPALIAAAQREAHGLWARMLLANDVPAVVRADGTIERFPQIAYGISPIVEGWLALADATGDDRYAVAAGLTARWLAGDNAAGAAVYDAAHGRVYDGIDGPRRLNRDAGAESTIEGLLALDAVAGSPVAVRARGFGCASSHACAAGPARSILSPPDRRELRDAAGNVLIVERDRDEGFRVRERPAGAVELTYWPAANPVEVALARRLTDDWNRRHPGVHVRVQPIPAGRSSEEVLLAAIVGRSTPDVCSNVSAALLARLARADGVVRLDTLEPTAARLHERATDPMSAAFRMEDGGLYAFPWKTNPVMLLYDADALAEAGVHPPRTHADLHAAFRGLARDADGDGARDRWAMWAPLKTTWFERFFDFYPLYLAASEGRTLLHDGRIAFDDAAAVSAMEVLRAGFAERLLPLANFAGSDPFIDGTVAMKLVGPWFLHELEELRQDDFRYGVVPVPVPDGADPDQAYAFGDVKHMAVFASTRHPVEAARFVAFLTSPEADRLLVEEATQLPYRRGLVRDARFTEALRDPPALAAYATRVERIRDVDLHPDVVEILDVLSESYEAGAIYRTITAREAVRRAAAEGQTVLDASR